jgi:hypothetical protein
MHRRIRLAGEPKPIAILWVYFLPDPDRHGNQHRPARQREKDGVEKAGEKSVGLTVIRFLAGTAWGGFGVEGIVFERLHLVFAFSFDLCITTEAKNSPFFVITCN